MKTSKRIRPFPEANLAAAIFTAADLIDGKKVGKKPVANVAMELMNATAEAGRLHGEIRKLNRLKNLAVKWAMSHNTSEARESQGKLQDYILKNFVEIEI